MNIVGQIKPGSLAKTELDKVTERIIGCAHKVSNALGAGFVEKVYENAFAHEMRKDGLKVLQQYPIQVVYDGIIVGEFFADMLVESIVIVELKAIAALTDEHWHKLSTICGQQVYQLVCSSILDSQGSRSDACTHLHPGI